MSYSATVKLRNWSGRQQARLIDWFRQPVDRKIDAILYGLDEFAFKLKEKIYGVEFGRVVPLHDLQVDAGVSLANANIYGPTRRYRIKKLLEECFFNRKERFERFIDVGCGKGLPCVVAASDGRFKELVGLDFSRPLIDAANANKEKLKLKNVTYLQADATSYMIPDGSTLVYLYNPFNEVVLKQFLSNNMDHFRNNNSIIAYANDLHRDTLLDFGFDVIYRSQWYNMTIFRLRKPDRTGL